MGEVFFFLQAHNQSINQTISFVSYTDHKYRNMLSILSSKHVVSCTDVPFGGYNILI